jgi:hypothetical protein
MNWDAALNRRNKLMGVGLIAWDHSGTVRASMCIVVPYVFDPMIIEAIGAQKRVEFGRHMGFHPIDLEGGAQEIVDALGKVDECCGRYGSIITDTRKLLTYFQSSTVKHVRAVASDSQPFFLNLGNKITFCFPIKKKNLTINSLIFSYIN